MDLGLNAMVKEVLSEPVALSTQHGILMPHILSAWRELRFTHKRVLDV